MKQCYFCSQNAHYIDYKDIDALKRFVSFQAKIYSTKKTGICAYHQRKLSKAIKRARFLALIPYTNVHR